jgi:histone H3/H4
MREPTKAELVAEGDAKPGMGDIAKRVGEKWKLLSEDEKAAYKQKAETINAENEREYAAKIASGEIVEGGEDDKDDNEPDLSLPLARVKRIMRLDKEVKNTAVDACRLVSRATELFVESLVEGAFQTMKAQKRKTVKHGDVEHHVLRKPRLEFLHDHGTFFFLFFHRPRRARRAGVD